MPVERVSKQFKDISLTFQVNPITFDIIDIRNETSIARSIRNLVLTLRGERFFNQNLGSNLSKSLFENLSSITELELRDEITNTINNYEPRVKLINVDINSSEIDANELNVTIRYYIIGIDALPQQLTFALQSVR
jgi:phage baseplate assembly protein W